MKHLIGRAFIFLGAKRDDAIYNPITRIIFPSSIKYVGSDIVDDREVKQLGLRNYRGQQIPKEVFENWYYTSISAELEGTNLEGIYLFRGDSVEPYMRIDPKELIGCFRHKSEALAKIWREEQER